MTTDDKPDIQAENKKLFLAELTRCERDPHGRRDFIVAGKAWSNWLHEDRLSLREGEIGFTVRPAYTKPGFSWEWDLKLADGVYLRSGSGSKQIGSLVDAALQVLSFDPEFVDFEYLGRTWRWWVEREGRWKAAIDGEEAEVIHYSSSVDEKEPKFGWSRRYRLGAEVLKMVNGGYRGISGDASSREEAFRACVDAPQLFRRACGALVAQCSEPKSLSAAKAEGLPDAQ